MGATGGCDSASARLGAGRDPRWGRERGGEAASRVGSADAGSGVGVREARGGGFASTEAESGVPGWFACSEWAGAVFVGASRVPTLATRRGASSGRRLALTNHAPAAPRIAATATGTSTDRRG